MIDEVKNVLCHLQGKNLTLARIDLIIFRFLQGLLGLKVPH